MPRRPTTWPRSPANTHHPRPERGRPAVRHADLRRRVRGRRRLPRHGDVAVPSAPRRAACGDRRQARRRAVRQGRRVDGAPGGWRSSGSASSPACPTSSPGTPPTTCSARSTRSACATARTSSSTATTSRPRSRSGRRSRSASTRRSIWEQRPRLVHDAAVQRARDLRLPRGHRPGRVRQRRARGGPAHPALGQGPARHVQVRPRRRVHQRAPGPAQARPRQDRQAARGRRRGVAAGRRGRRAPGSRHARRQDARQDLRRDLGDRHRQGRPAAGRCTSTTSSTTSGRCANTVPRRSSGRRRSTRSWPSSCSPAGRGRGPASSARRRSTRSRSSTC